MTAHLINAGTRVRYTMRLDRHDTVALHGVVVTTYGRAFADVLFEGAPKATKVATCDLTPRPADVIPLGRRADSGAWIEPDGRPAA